MRLTLDRAPKLGLVIRLTELNSNIVASAIRMSFFFTNELATDPFWMANKLHIWCLLESATAVIAACMPSTWPVVKRARGPWQRLVGSWSRSF